MMLCTAQGQPADIIHFFLCSLFIVLCHAGEAFDKVARLLGLDLRPNGGAALEAFAKQGDPYRFKFTVPLLRHIDCNFSYAGLKNSVRLAIEAEAPGAATDANLQVFSNQNTCRVESLKCSLCLRHWQPTSVGIGRYGGIGGGPGGGRGRVGNAHVWSSSCYVNFIIFNFNIQLCAIWL